MSTHTPTPTSKAAPPECPVRQGLADRAVCDRLMCLVRAALGHFPRGLTFAQREAEAEEYFQEVAKRALHSAAGFDPERGTLLHWLGTIVWRVASGRQHPHELATDPSSLAETLVDRRGAASTVHDDVEIRLDSKHILSSLPTADAELLRLHFDGFTAQEIGQRLNITTGNVRVKISRALKGAREMFGDDEREVGP